jgi:hypothetical protein
MSFFMQEHLLIIRMYHKKYQKTAENQLLSVPTEVAEIVDVWPELPVHIKAAIKALVQTYKESE